MMRAAYKRYLSYGHTRWAAFTLAAPAWLWYGSAIAAGILITLLLDFFFIT